jgi:hypothetical protein
MDPLFQLLVLVVGVILALYLVATIPDAPPPAPMLKLVLRVVIVLVALGLLFRFAGFWGPGPGAPLFHR